MLTFGKSDNRTSNVITSVDTELGTIQVFWQHKNFLKLIWRIATQIILKFQFLGQVTDCLNSLNTDYYTELNVQLH